MRAAPAVIWAGRMIRKKSMLSGLIRGWDWFSEPIMLVQR
jgi:hypothetical protein